MLERPRMNGVADIVFTQSQTPEKGEAILCLCSRAFVKDRELYCSDNRLLSSGKEVTEVQESEKDDEENVLDEESQLMVKMGLPLAFASSSEQKIQQRRRWPQGKPITWKEELPKDKEADKDLQPLHKTDECKNELHWVPGLGLGLSGAEEETHDPCWETYWGKENNIITSMNNSILTLSTEQKFYKA
ncbi:trimethylguanosine synthase-like [Fundulus heteroclitus]|uniref:trimethylguanosine synthase-like n=1 Tax=Fundulus heteroclitus TaxID=8078 RepID=UPI00165C2798|nr:trimethylguanosine synthase-like [Fundulus heteroclitus]